MSETRVPAAYCDAGEPADYIVVLDPDNQPMEIGHYVDTESMDPTETVYKVLPGKVVLAGEIMDDETEYNLEGQFIMKL